KFSSSAATYNINVNMKWVEANRSENLHRDSSRYHAVRSIALRMVQLGYMSHQPDHRRNMLLLRIPGTPSMFRCCEFIVSGPLEIGHAILTPSKLLIR